MSDLSECFSYSFSFTLGKFLINLNSLFRSILKRSLSFYIVLFIFDLRLIMLKSDNFWINAEISLVSPFSSVGFLIIILFWISLNCSSYIFIIIVLNSLESNFLKLMQSNVCLLSKYISQNCIL